MKVMGHIRVFKKENLTDDIVAKHDPSIVNVSSTRYSLYNNVYICLC